MFVPNDACRSAGLFLDFDLAHHNNQYTFPIHLLVIVSMQSKEIRLFSLTATVEIVATAASELDTFLVPADPYLILTKKMSISYRLSMLANLRSY